MLSCGLGSQEILICVALIRFTCPSIGALGTVKKIVLHNTVHNCLCHHVQQSGKEAIPTGSGLYGLDFYNGNFYKVLRSKVMV